MHVCHIVFSTTRVFYVNKLHACETGGRVGGRQADRQTGRQAGRHRGRVCVLGGSMGRWFDLNPSLHIKREGYFVK